MLNERYRKLQLGRELGSYMVFVDMRVMTERVGCAVLNKPLCLYHMYNYATKVFEDCVDRLSHYVLLKQCEL